MRVLYLTQWFDPEPSALKGASFARALTDAGLEVEVITGFPNYGLGRIYPGYRVKLFQRDVIDGIVVDRVPALPEPRPVLFRASIELSVVLHFGRRLWPWPRPALRRDLRVSSANHSWIGRRTGRPRVAKALRARHPGPLAGLCGRLRHDQRAQSGARSRATLPIRLSPRRSHRGPIGGDGHEADREGRSG